MGKKKTYNDLLESIPPERQAHKYSSNHMEQLKKDTLCGCFYCLRLFHPEEIEEWLIDDNPIDIGGTAICPYCGIDSVIGESSGYPMTVDFLKKMNRVWFQE